MVIEKVYGAKEKEKEIDAQEDAKMGRERERRPRDDNNGWHYRGNARKSRAERGAATQRSAERAALIEKVHRVRRVKRASEHARL